jgi:hypothetical protein
MVVGTWYLEQVISHWLKDLALFVVTGGGERHKVHTGDGYLRS